MFNNFRCEDFDDSFLYNNVNFFYMSKMNFNYTSITELLH